MLSSPPFALINNRALSFLPSLRAHSYPYGMPSSQVITHRSAVHTFRESGVLMGRLSQYLGPCATYALFFSLGGYALGMYLMLKIGKLGQYKADIPDFMVFLEFVKRYPETRGLPPHWFRPGAVVDEIVRDPADDLFR